MTKAASKILLPTAKEAPAEWLSPPLRIISAREGFRRAGVAHPLGATDYEAGAWTLDQLILIENEPMLEIAPITTSLVEHATSVMQIAEAVRSAGDTDPTGKAEA